MLPSILRNGKNIALAARSVKPTATAGQRLLPRRNMAGGGKRNLGGPNEHVPIEVPFIDRFLGKGLAVIAWLWMMYRAKKDGKVLLGLEHPWDHLEDHHDDNEVPKWYVYQMQPGEEE